MPADDEGKKTHPWVLAAMVTASGTVWLSSSAINITLPAIAAGLDASFSALQWVIDGYLLTLAALLILGGSLGDRYGRRRMALIGLGGFALTSIACGLAPSTAWLIGGRLLQGVAGALLVPESLAILRAVYTDRAARGRALGIWEGGSGVALVTGPLLGGWLVETFSWRWVFWINLPLVAVAAWLIARRVPESRDPQAPRRLDWAGAALTAVGLGGLAYVLIEAPVAGQTWPVLLALALGIAGLVALLLVEWRIENPMLPLHLLRERNFAGGNLTTLGLYMALQGPLFFGVLYLQNVTQLTALAVGSIMAPIAMLLLALAPLVGHLAGRWGSRAFLAAGPIVAGVGLLLLAGLHPEATIWGDIVPGVTLFGLGLAMTIAPLTATVMSAAPDRHSGVASAFNNVVSRVAGLLAVAGLGAVLSLTFQSQLAAQMETLSTAPAVRARIQDMVDNPTGALDIEDLPPVPKAAVEMAYTTAFRRVMLASAGLAFAAGVAAAILVRNQRREPGAQRELELETGPG